MVSEVVNSNSFQIKYVPRDPDRPFYGDPQNVNSTAFGAYTSCGVISVINNFNITTSQFSPFQDEGLQVRLGYLDLFMEGADDGEFSVNLYLNQEQDVAAQTLVCSPATTTGQQKIWVRNVANVTAQYVQVELTLSQLQLADPEKWDFDLTLHAMQLYLDPASRFMFGVQL
jgi:hypothetical protein